MITTRYQPRVFWRQTPTTTSHMISHHQVSSTRWLKQSVHQAVQQRISLTTSLMSSLILSQARVAGQHPRLRAREWWAVVGAAVPGPAQWAQVSSVHPWLRSLSTSQQLMVTSHPSLPSSLSRRTASSRRCLTIVSQRRGEIFSITQSNIFFIPCILEQMSFKSRPPLIVSQSALTIIAGKTCLFSSINASNQHFSWFSFLINSPRCLRKNSGNLTSSPKCPRRSSHGSRLQKWSKYFKSKLHDVWPLSSFSFVQF